MSPLTLDVPPGFGFTSLEGRLEVAPRQHRARLVVTGKKAPDNLGPGLSRVFAVNWHRGHEPALREELLGMMRVVRNLVTARLLPARGLFMDTCNTTGEDYGSFVEQTCSGCVCAYCELSSG